MRGELSRRLGGSLLPPKAPLCSHHIPTPPQHSQAGGAKPAPCLGSSAPPQVTACVPYNRSQPPTSAPGEDPKAPPACAAPRPAERDSPGIPTAPTDLAPPLICPTGGISSALPNQTFYFRDLCPLLPSLCCPRGPPLAPVGGTGDPTAGQGLRGQPECWQGDVGLRVPAEQQIS